MAAAQKLRFEDKVCLVTGGGSGIGRATCMQLAEEGGHVIVIDVNAQNGAQTVQAITSARGQAVFAHADVSVEGDVQSSIQTAVDRWSKIDVLVNNAAIMTFDPIAMLTSAQWDKVLAVNLRSVFLYCKYCLPHMDHGAIVNVSSVHAHETTTNVVPYATSKGGMEAFTRGLSRECASSKIRVNCVAPGAVDTPMLWSNPNVKSGKEKIEGVVGKPENLAAAICFLASDEACFITGTTLVVDGGRLGIL